jgi:hypothetical protein
MSTSLATESQGQQLFGLSTNGTSPSLRLGSTNAAAHIHWNSLQNTDRLELGKQMSVQTMPELRRSPAYQLTSSSAQQQQKQQQMLVNALNASSNLKRKHSGSSTASPLIRTESKDTVLSSPVRQTKIEPPEKPNNAAASSVVTVSHPFVRYTDAISQRLVLHHPDAVGFWARCPICHKLICCIDQKTSCYRMDAIEKHFQVLHTQSVWIISNADLMWGACNPISGGFDRLSMFMDTADGNKESIKRSEKDPSEKAEEKKKDTDDAAVEKDVLRAMALEAKTQFRFAAAIQDTHQDANKRRRAFIPQCVAGSTAHPRTKCTQTCYLDMIG